MNQTAHDADANRISVVIPSYNHERYVEQCLLSVMRQTVAPMELIVIDDGSIDDSPRIIERVLSDCPFPCEFYTRENRGLCNTLNEALEKAKGQLFAYLSSDDIWLPGFLESRSRALANAPDAPLVYGHSYAIDDDSRVICYTYGSDLTGWDSTREMLLFSFVPSSPSILYRKKFLENDRWNPAIKLEDFDLYLRLCVKGEFAFDANVLSAWRTHSGNTSKQAELMAHECIGAVERNAEALNLTKAELAACVKGMKVNLVDTLLDRGERVEAIKMFFENIRGFRNTGELMRRAAKLLAPRSVIERRRDLSKKYLPNKRSIGSIDENFHFVKA